MTLDSTRRHLATDPDDPQALIALLRERARAGGMAAVLEPLATANMGCGGHCGFRPIKRLPI